MREKYIIEVISSLLILLFVYTATSKLSDYNQFKYVLSKSPLIGAKTQMIAGMLPVLEYLVSLLLLLPMTRLWGLYGSLFLMTGFTIYLAYMIYFTSYKPCSCGGVLKQMTWKQHLFFNVFFVLLSLTGLVLQRKQQRGKVTVVN